MTVRKVWLGSTGPFLYDDSVLYIDEDGVISPDNQQAIATDGQIVIQSPPSSPVHAVRKQDLDDAVGDIAGLTARVDALETSLGVTNTNLANAITTLNAADAALDGRIGVLEGKFRVYSFTINYYGWTIGPYSYATKAVVVDQHAFLHLPQLIAPNSAADYIQATGIPPAIFPVSVAANVPAFVYSDAQGVEVGTALFQTGDLFLRPYTKQNGFPTGAAQKGVMLQTIVYLL